MLNLGIYLYPKQNVFRDMSCERRPNFVSYNKLKRTFYKVLPHKSSWTKNRWYANQHYFERHHCNNYKNFNKAINKGSLRILDKITWSKKS